MFLQSKFLTAAALLVALSAFATTLAQAQQLVGSGHGSYVGLSSPSVLHFDYVVRDLGNGAADGYAIWRGPNSIILWQVNSVMTLPGTTSQAFAGPILHIVGTPPPGLVVGATVFTASNDNGRGAADSTASLSVIPPLSSIPVPIPPQFGNLTTIQQIIGFLTFVNFPPPRFQPLLRGDIWIR